MFDTERKQPALRPRIAGVSGITPQMRTLQRALQDFAGEAELAKVLGVSVETLSGWLGGEEVLPTSIYLRALDLVAAGR
jgi:transcriptional regulator with XRE-family HTH domain